MREFLRSCKARVNAGPQALLLGDFSQEDSELFPFAGTQRRAEVILMRAGDATQRIELGSARRRQAKCIGAPVIRPRAALDETLLLEAVDEQHQTAGKGAQELRERSLRHIRLVRQVPEDPCLRRGQAERRESLGKTG